jgi:hypothetical protein
LVILNEDGIELVIEDGTELFVKLLINNGIELLNEGGIDLFVELLNEDGIELITCLVRI